MLESDFQARVIKRLQTEFPGMVVLKNDANYKQGFPDLTLLFNDQWAALEVKASEKARLQANQAHWINTLDGMSLATLIYPENEEEVFRGLHEAFGVRR